MKPLARRLAITLILSAPLLALAELHYQITSTASAPQAETESTNARLTAAGIERNAKRIVKDLANGLNKVRLLR